MKRPLYEGSFTEKVSDQSNEMILSSIQDSCMPSDSVMSPPLDASCDPSVADSNLFCLKRQEHSLENKSEPLKKKSEMIEGESSTRYSNEAMDSKPLQALRYRVNK